VAQQDGGQFATGGLGRLAPQHIGLQGGLDLAQAGLDLPAPAVEIGQFAARVALRIGQREILSIAVDGGITFTRPLP